MFCFISTVQVSQVHQFQEWGWWEVGSFPPGVRELTHPKGSQSRGILQSIYPLKKCWKTFIMDVCVFHFLQAETLIIFTFNYLNKNVNRVNSLGKQRLCLPPEPRAGLLAPLRHKNRMYLQKEMQAYLLPILKDLDSP